MKLYTPFKTLYDPKYSLPSIHNAPMAFIRSKLILKFILYLEKIFFLTQCFLFPWISKRLLRKYIYLIICSILPWIRPASNLDPVFNSPFNSPLTDQTRLKLTLFLYSHSSFIISIHIVLMLTSIFSIIFIRKEKRFVSKQGQPQPHVHGLMY